MLTLLKNLECFTPQYRGKKDILIVCGKIHKIQQAGKIQDSPLIDKTFDCDGLLAFPGLIDQHVHIIGGGGEEGFASRVGEIDIRDILMAGVTTLVGLLGTDGCTRSLEALYAKAKGLEIQGITTYIYSGSYSIPVITFTQNIVKDLVLIDKVIGTGEIALSDHRSSHADSIVLLSLASDTHIGGLLGSKAGVVHLHIGDGKDGLAPLLKIVKESDLPIEEFVPTHVNRNPVLFNQAIEYCKGGGNIDLTAGEAAGIPVPDAVERLIHSGFDLSHVTVSSDSNGSIPAGGSGKIQCLYDDITDCIVRKKLEPETVFRLVTENVAKVLKLYPRKGTLQEGSDADILITDKNYKIDKLFSMGKLMVENGHVAEGKAPS